jgi:hypothetical protein
MSRLLRLLAALYLGGSAFTVNASEPLQIKIPKITEQDVRAYYPADLLHFLLEKTGTDYTVQRTTERYSQSRAVESLKSNKIQLLWMGTSAQAEQELLPIRFPMYRGLMGYRVFIIHRAQQPKFRSITSLNDLQKLTGMQGIGWSDITILETSGLKQSEHEYEHIFQLIQAKRGDYFSRGLLEVFLEVDEQQKLYPDLTIDQSVLLTYPHALFFFTGKQNPELAKLLTNAFETTYQDGSFEQFFYNHPTIKEGITRANLEGRSRIDISNPILSPETLNIKPQYWHRVE